MNALQDQAFRHDRTTSTGLAAGWYSGPFACYPDGLNIQVTDGAVYWGRDKDTLGSTTAVSLSAYASATVYVTMVMRSMLNQTVSFEFATSTTQPDAETYFGSPLRRVVLGVATTDADGYVTSWRQFQYGDSYIQQVYLEFQPFFDTTAGSPQETIFVNVGRVYVGNTSWYFGGSNFTPGASVSGYTYLEFDSGATTSALSHTTNGNVPSGAAGKTLIILGYYATDGDGEFTHYDLMQYGVPHVLVIRSYAPDTDTTTSDNGLYTPLLLEATGITGTATFATDTNLKYRKGGVYEKN